MNALLPRLLKSVALAPMARSSHPSPSRSTLIAVHRLVRTARPWLQSESPLVLLHVVLASSEGRSACSSTLEM